MCDRNMRKAVPLGRMAGTALDATLCQLTELWLYTLPWFVHGPSGEGAESTEMGSPPSAAQVGTDCAAGAGDSVERVPVFPVVPVVPVIAVVPLDHEQFHPLLPAGYLGWDGPQPWW